MTADFGKQLEAEQKRLQASLGDAADGSEAVELDQTRQGRLSRMDAMQQQAMAQAARRRAEARLKQIAAALQRIKDGDYGECFVCGEPIQPGRLQADPCATLCIHCAEMQER